MKKRKMIKVGNFFAFLTASAFICAANANTLPVAVGNCWVYRYDKTSTTATANVSERGKLVLTISTLSNKNDSTFFTLECSDSDTLASNAITTITNEMSTKRITLYGDSISSDDSLTISSMDIGVLLSYRRLRDSSSNSSGYNWSSGWSRTTDSSILMLNGVSHNLFVTTQYWGSYAEMHGGEATYDTVQWINNIGVLKHSFVFVSGPYTVKHEVTHCTLISFNNIIASAEGVRDQPAIADISRQRNIKSIQKKIFWGNSGIGRLSHYFNLRGQGVNNLHGSQIFIQVTK